MCGLPQKKPLCSQKKPIVTTSPLRLCPRPFLIVTNSPPHVHMQGMSETHLNKINIKINTMYNVVWNQTDNSIRIMTRKLHVGYHVNHLPLKLATVGCSDRPFWSCMHAFWFSYTISINLSLAMEYCESMLS